MPSTVNTVFSSAPPRISRQDRKEALVAHIDGDTVAGIEVASLGTEAARELAYAALADTGAVEAVATETEVDEILAALEDRARQLGVSVIRLNARETALGFYLKHGYSPCGAGEMLFNRIAHVRMKKDLTDS